MYKTYNNEVDVDVQNLKKEHEKFNNLKVMDGGLLLIY